MNIWITGASSGIGAALSQHYAREGVTLGLVARRGDLMDNVATLCRKKGAIVHTYVADVINADHLRQCSNDFQSKVGFVHLVIANAGIRVVEDDEFQNLDISTKVMQTNFHGVLNTFSPFIPTMKKNRSGKLAVVSSIAAFRGTPNSGIYSASKAAVNVWLESLRLRLKPYSIDVSTLCAGFTDTEMTESLPFWMPGILTAEKAAKIIANAIAKRKRSLMFPWQSKFIWSCFRILPGSWYDKLILWAKENYPNR